MLRKYFKKGFLFEWREEVSIKKRFLIMMLLLSPLLIVIFLMLT